MNIKKNIPNFLTLCNLFCGCVAIVFAFQGDLVWSAYMVGIACVFDFLDGLAARALNVYSETGKQLDSLADIVSFGVVPGVTMYFLLRGTYIISGSPYDVAAFSRNGIIIFPLIGFSITIFSAIRLAKFNLDTRQRDSFIGLPTPANTLFITFLPFALDKVKGDLYQIILNPFFFFIFFFSITIIFSFLLIAPLPLFSLKFKNFSWTDNWIRYLFMALAAVMFFIFQLAGIPLIIILYIVLSVINNLFSKSVNVNPANYE